MSIFAIILNLTGVIILSVPLFRLKEWLEDDEIIESAKVIKYTTDKKGEEKETERCWCIRKGQIKFRRVSFFGLFFIIIGTLLEILIYFN